MKEGGGHIDTRTTTIGSSRYGKGTPRHKGTGKKRRRRVPFGNSWIINVRPLAAWYDGKKNRPNPFVLNRPRCNDERSLFAVAVPIRVAAVLPTMAAARSTREQTNVLVAPPLLHPTIWVNRSQSLNADRLPNDAVVLTHAISIIPSPLPPDE